MQAPMNEYYTDDEYQHALKQMRRMLEGLRLRAQIQLALAAKESVKEKFEESVTESAENTKSSIQKIEEQMDTAIKGKVRDKLEQVVKEKLPDYDNVTIP